MSERTEEVIEMAVVAEQLHRHPRAPHLAPARDPNEVIAVVLADGTVRDLREPAESRPRRRILNGTLSGPDWILWWQRRSFARSAEVAPA